MQTMTDTHITPAHLAPVKNFYRSLTLESLADIDSIYHPNIVFTDPAGSISGLEKLQQHFKRLLENTRQCTCEFDDAAEFSGGNQAVLSWRMTLQITLLASQRTFSFDGVSLLRYQDNLIIHHRDYFDMGQMLYEQLPLLGPVIRRLRRRLAAS